jgi:RNA polymerase sigma-70 factor (ECF subfamily)
LADELIKRPADAEVEAVYAQEAARVLATLIRLLGDFDLAEDARQEAFAAALTQWPTEGLPQHPRAWLISAGRNKIIDRLRRDVRFSTKIADLESAAAQPHGQSEDDLDQARFGDDRLRLIFTCCHPALIPEAQVALTLREVCGLPTHAVARAFLVGEEAMWQRLVRAKRKIREARIPYETPGRAVLGERLDGVLGVIYSVFTEGYAATQGDRLIDVELCAEAIRLGKLLDELMPNEAAITGLLALMLLQDARRDARVSASGDIVLLKDQDRSLWDRAKIAEGLALVDRALALKGRVSPYTVQAAIAALHARAIEGGGTDWPQIIGLYAVLSRLQPSPIVELNRAVAISMVERTGSDDTGLGGPAQALSLLDSLAARQEIMDSHLLHAARAYCLERLGRIVEAREAYAAALACVMLEPERRLLAARAAALAP